MTAQLQLPQTGGKPVLTAVDMQRALYRHMVAQWAVLFEISTGGLQVDILRGGARRRRIDMLCVRNARKAGIGPLDLLAVEIKVSRSDFFTDVREPAKQAPWREVAHRHAFAVPRGLIRREEVPAGSGLLTVGEDRRFNDVKWEVRAPYSISPEIPSWLTLALAYRLSAAEAKTRGLSTTTDGDPESLRGELVHARQQIDRLSRAHDRALAEAREWRTAYAATGGLPCRWCEQQVKPVSVRRGQFTDWRHVDRGHDAKCEEIRLAGGEYGRYHLPGPKDVCDEAGAVE